VTDVARRPAAVLYLDHEGGWGGASRSLRFLVAGIDRARFAPEVWCRRAGPFREYLAAQGIACAVEPGLVGITPRTASNAKNWVAHAGAIRTLPAAAGRIAAHRHDIVHFNLEGLVPLARLLDRRGDARPRVLHVRTMNPANAITRFYARYMSRAFRHVIFISENERARFIECGFDGETTPHTVLPNPVDPALFELSPVANPDRPLRVVFFGGLDAVRAPDRLIAVAQRLKHRNANVQIDVFGRSPPYRKWLIFERRNDVALGRQIEQAGVADIVRLRGYTLNPEREMAASDLVIRPSRLSDPWGRDVIESMAVGVPVLASGTYQGFVRDGETGVLIDPWSPEAAADWIARLAADRALCRRFGAAARQRARMLFDPARYAARVGEIYDEVLKAA
jgi:glycosyltransferase involved in cell wall biosynthesis